MSDISLKEAAKILNLKPERMYFLIKTGRLRACKKDGKRFIYFLRADIENYKERIDSPEFIKPSTARVKTKESLSAEELGIKNFKGKMITTTEAARFFRVSERWVNKHMKAKTFPVRHLPLGLRFKRVFATDLTSWMEKMIIEAGILPASFPKKSMKKILEKMLKEVHA